MPRRAGILNVRNHLENLQQLLDGLEDLGYCPLIESELRKVALINRAILRKEDEKRARGSRHDIYIPRVQVDEEPQLLANIKHVPDWDTGGGT